MPWFNVDDGFSNSKPVLRIPRRYRCAAIGLWTLAGSWSAKELTDGFIPDHALEEFAGTVPLAEWLVRAGLWKKVEGGWQFEGWSKWQKTKERVLAYREREAEKKRGQRSKPKGAGSDSVSPGDSLGTESRVPSGQNAESPTCPAQPLPTPSPSPKPEENLGGDLTQVGHRPPRPHCPDHPNENSEDRCRHCMRRRKWDEEQEILDKDDELEQRRRAKTAEAQAQSDCLSCDDDGWILAEDGTPADPAMKCQIHLEGVS